MLSVVNGPTDNETQAVPGGGQCLRSAEIDDSTAPNFTALADAAALGVSALAGVVAGARDGITIVDADRRFVYANPVACEMLGYSLAELGGRDFLDSIPVR
jgi:PAS domain-containing protein